ncbi:RlpA-like double-psi beta-barrel-protein domain-containing protein-containing protein [Armillaria luteobubalina]|uniref:RlpA-like double-psi beta-barrel-protein domain-containing protein-containing protein n=1 Tax=Armillaria luteobubalina TaxID=153913 RepID=A0AA39UWG5_9AGAR|nr:RlpA-like double-psi beta-barrel-protein domain-containing protein-containing protein [Armillaria luteobubalina]
MRFPSLTMICSTALFFLLLDVCYAHPSPRPHEGPWQRHAARDMRRRSSFHLGGSNGGQLQKRGSFTYYEVGLGACGGTNSASDYVVALNAAQWDGGSHCYETITITVNGQSVQAQIVDQCPGCGSGDLDFSQGLFQHFADTSVGVLSGSFSFGSGVTTTSQTPTTTQQPTTSSTSTYTPPSTTSTSQYTPTTTSTPPPTTSTSSTSTSSSTTSSSSSSSTHAPLTSTTTTSESYSGLQVLEQINSFVVQLAELAVVGAQQL